MKRLVLIFLGLMAIGAGMEAWDWLMAPKEAAPSSPEPEAKPAAPAMLLLERPTTKPRPMASVKPDAGVAIAATAPAPMTAMTDAGAPSSPSAEQDGPVDRREHAGPRAAAEHEALKYAFQTIDEDVTECLAQWAKVDPHAPPQVMLAFEIDKDGIQKSWLEHDGDVPFGVQSCIAGAAYGLDWSHIVEQPAKLTMKFGSPRDQ